MSRPASGDAEVLREARQAIACAKTVEQLRQAQAVVLPLDYAMSLADTAQVIGVSKGWACQLRREFIRGHKAGDPELPTAGGRKRQNMSVTQEREFLAPFLESASAGGVLVVGQIKAALDKQLEREVPLIDGAGWHRSAELKAPANIHLLKLPPYAPELNPIEHVWDELREKSFHNRVFNSLDALEDHLATALKALEQDPNKVESIVSWPWIISAFLVSLMN